MKCVANVKCAKVKTTSIRGRRGAWDILLPLLGWAARNLGVNTVQTNYRYFAQHIYPNCSTHLPQLLGIWVLIRSKPAIQIDSILLNTFTTIAQHIYHNCSTHLPQLLNTSTTIAQHIYHNCFAYLPQLLNTFTTIARNLGVKTVKTIYTDR